MPLDKQSKYYKENREKFEFIYNDKFIVIKANTVIGAYGSHQAAYDETVKQHEVGTFIIKHPEKKGTANDAHANSKGVKKYNRLSLIIIIIIILASVAVYIKYESSLKQIDQNFSQGHTTSTR